MFDEEQVYDDAIIVTEQVEEQVYYDNQVDQYQQNQYPYNNNYV